MNDLHKQLIQTAKEWRVADLKQALIDLGEIDGDPKEAAQALQDATVSLRIATDRVTRSTRRVKQFDVEYSYFEVGDVVTPTSPRCVLDMGEQYIITECHEPMFAEDKAICFVEGHKTGITTDYLRSVR